MLRVQAMIQSRNMLIYENISPGLPAQDLHFILKNDPLRVLLCET